MRFKGELLRRAGACVFAAGIFVLALRALPEHLYHLGLDWSLSATSGSPEDYGNSGEVILHGIPSPSGADNIFLPMSSLVGTFIFSHVSPETWKFLRILSGCAAFFLLLSLAGMMGSMLRGVYAVALLLLLSAVCPDAPEGIRWHGHYGYPHSFLSLLVLIVAGCCAWLAQRPSPFRALILGASIGVTLLYRSTLLFFPVFFVICDRILRRTESPRLNFKSALILLLAPYFFLIPWMGMNWIVHHRLSPLENGEANIIIVAGALGMGPNSQNQLSSGVKFNGKAAIWESSTESILVWAAGEVLRHPLRFLKGYWLRLCRVVLLHPILVFLALLGLWRHRARKEILSVGLLAGYYLLIHCFMAIEPRYFDPLWPLLAVLAAFCLIRPGNLPEPGKGGASETFSLYFLRGAVGFGLILSLFTVYTIGVYAYDQTRAGSAIAERLNAAIGRYPDCSWLLSERGLRRLEGGDLQGAIEDMSKAAALRPDKLRSARLAWAKALAGAPATMLEWELMPDSVFYHREINFDALILKAHISLRLGKTREARRYLRSAFELSGGTLLERSKTLLNGRPSAERIAFYDEIARVAPPSRALWLERSTAALEHGDAQLALKFLRGAESLGLDRDDRVRASRLRRGMAGLGINQAQVALELGQRKQALHFLARAEAFDLSKDDRFRILRMYESMKEFEKARILSESLTRDFSQEAGNWINQARLAYRLGDLGLALKSLRQAEDLGLDREERLQVLQIYQDMKQYRKALALAESLARDFPREVASWLNQAKLAIAMGNRGLAFSSLRRAETLSLGALDRHGIALIYQDMKEYAPALKILDQLIRERPADAKLLSDRGLCKYLSGAPEAGIEELRAALKLDPRLLPAYLTLGAIYTAKNRSGEALKLYDLALKEEAADPDLREKIIRSRRELLAKKSKRDE